jgi:hypothetical protein
MPRVAIAFTNDNLPTASGLSVVGQRAVSTKSSAPGNGGKPGGAPGGKSETYWRQRFSEVRTKLRQAQEAVEIMHRELGELNVQYYPNPQEPLAQSITRSNINSKMAAIAAKKKEVAALQQQLSDKEDELRKSGGDPGGRGTSSSPGHNSRKANQPGTIFIGSAVISGAYARCAASPTQTSSFHNAHQ